MGGWGSEREQGIKLHFWQCSLFSLCKKQRGVKVENKQKKDIEFRQTHRRKTQTKRHTSYNQCILLV